MSCSFTLSLALLREPAIREAGATVERAGRVGAGVPQSQCLTAIRALRRQLHATEDVRADPVMQFVHETRRTRLVHHEKQLLFATRHRHVKQPAFLRVRHAFHFRQQQAEQRLFRNRAWETLQTAGTAQQKNEIALQTLGSVRGHEFDVHVRFFRKNDAAGMLVDLEQPVAVVA